MSDELVAMYRGAAAALGVALQAYGRHPGFCPKGVGVGYYKPPSGAVCNCGIDIALAALRASERLDPSRAPRVSNRCWSDQ